MKKIKVSRQEAAKAIDDTHQSLAEYLSRKPKLNLLSSPVANTGDGIELTFTAHPHKPDCSCCLCVDECSCCSGRDEDDAEGL